jgi:hypothetical protein
MKKNKDNPSIVADYEKRLKDIEIKLKDAEETYKRIKRRKENFL